VDNHETVRWQASCVGLEPAVRRVKHDEKTRQRFTDAIISDNNRDFWLEVKRMNGKRVGCAKVVDDKTTVTSISDVFASHYKAYITASQRCHTIRMIYIHFISPIHGSEKTQIISERTDISGYSEDRVVTAKEMADSV